MIRVADLLGELSKLCPIEIDTSIMFLLQPFFFSDGLDFFFGFEPYARKMVDFLQSVVPCRYSTSKKLISHDANSNTYNYKYVFSVEVVSVCKDNVVCLPNKLARSLGKN